MSKIKPCLWFDTNAQEAVDFYVSVFRNSRIHSTAHYGPGGHMPEGTVLVIEFEIEGQKMQALNGGRPGEYTDSLSLSVSCDTQADIDHYWEKLTADGGKEVQCGWLVDRYGVSWQIVPRSMDELFAGSDQAACNRAMLAMMQMIKLDIATLEAAARG